MFTAPVVGGYLGRSMLLDDGVNERVVRVSATASEGPRDVLIGRGSFRPVAHAAEGTATTTRRAGGGRVLTLTDFEGDNGLDLRV